MAQAGFDPLAAKLPSMQTSHKGSIFATDGARPISGFGDGYDLAARKAGRTLPRDKADRDCAQVRSPVDPAAMLSIGLSAFRITT